MSTTKSIIIQNYTNPANDLKNLGPPLTPSDGSPMETENPVPVFFLTIGAGTRFVFRFFSRSNNMSHIHKTKTALLEGLSFFGIGAKTAAGYGRFKPGSPKGAKWLDNTIQKLCKKHNEPKAVNILRGKSLCSEWQGISDSELKQEILDEIHHRWKEKSITPSKRVMNMYHNIVMEYSRP